MGTDIHGVWQKRDGDKWVDIPSSYDQDRHYQLFAVLAGVRNGRGFAGCVTGNPVVPIAEPRGLPNDFEMREVSDYDEDVESGDYKYLGHPNDRFEILNPRRQEYYRAGETFNISMGDHSFSWLTGEEMLAWFKQHQTVTQAGILDREVYCKWDRIGAPSSYCGGISGRGIIVIDQSVEHDDPARLAEQDWTHISCTWEQNLNEELKYFFDEVRRLVDEHGEIRFVFGFDS